MERIGALIGGVRFQQRVGTDGAATADVPFLCQALGFKAAYL